MEFNKKLQELRKNKGLTQEELAEKLFVSRTAVSKWESGRGYPNIDSLKEISRFFSVTIDELICSEEMLSVAENEKKESIGKYLSLICSTLDMLPIILLFVPMFRNGIASLSVKILFDITGIPIWIKVIYAAVIGITIINGVCGMIISNFDKPSLNQKQQIVGMILSVIGVIVFMASRQPYAGMIFFVLLIIKGLLLFKAK